jgi:FMN-dependent NADH-azoreductase
MNERIIIDFKSNEGNNYIKSIQEELSKKFENDDAYVHIEINKDNPVPSIDDKYIQALIKVKSARNCRDLKAIKLVEDLIQNGVETDKEEPKLKCFCGEGYENPECTALTKKYNDGEHHCIHYE